MRTFNVGQALVEAQDWAAHAAKQQVRQSAQDVLSDTVRPLLEHVERLTLVTEAMWSLILERTDLTEADLSQRVTDLDLADGVKDNKHSKAPADCPDCGSKVCRRFSRCLFCGYKAPEESAFDAI